MDLSTDVDVHTKFDGQKMVGSAYDRVKDARSVTDLSYAGFLHEHLESILPGGGGSVAMRFLERTGACVAGSAAVKSFARCGHEHAVLMSGADLNTDVDFWVPYPQDVESVADALEWAVRTIPKDFAEYLGPNYKISGAMIKCQPMYERMNKNVAAIITVQTDEESKPILQFMIVQPGVRIDDVGVDLSVGGENLYH